MKTETIRVLIVEDNTDLAFLMKETLKLQKTCDYMPEIAVTLADALQALSKAHFDVAILDLDLSDSKGVDTVKAIYKKNPYIAIVAMTGAYSEELAAEVLAGGAQEYLIKTKYDDASLDKAIRYSVERKKVERKLSESEEKFRTIFENSAVGITVTDEQERIISWNRFAENLLGMSHEELYLRPVNSLYPKAEWKRIRSLDIQQTSICRHLETIMVKKDKTMLEVDISISVLKDSDGEVRGSIGIIRDISERKAAEKIIKDKVRRADVIFGLLQDLTPDIASNDMLKLIVTAAKSLVMADTASVILLDEENRGKPRVVASESSGLRVDGTVLQPSLDENTSITGYVIKNKTPLLLHNGHKNEERFKDIKWKGGIKYSINAPVIFKDSVKGTLNLNITTSDYIFTGDDLDAITALANHAAIALESSGLYKSMKDKYIEELKNSNEELKRARNQLVQSEKMSAVGQLASGVAHEINNPLSGVLGNIQIIKMELQSGGKIEDAGELLTVIEDSARRCKSITQNLLDFARVKKDVFEVFDIHKALDSVIMLVGHGLKNSNITLVRKYIEDPPAVVGNKNEVQQIFLNMISNAKWAIEKKGGIGSSITVETRKGDDGLLEASFSDTGIGISKEGINKLFEPFYTTKDVGKGTGLGLSLCYEILKRHKGKLEVESEEGKGATFRIKLPIAKDQGPNS